MKVNGSEISLVGISFAEIGRRILGLSPSPNGVGLVVELTPDEEQTFLATFGWKIGGALRELVADAVKANGLEPKFQFVYDSDRTFRTSAV